MFEHLPFEVAYIELSEPKDCSPQLSEASLKPLCCAVYIASTIVRSDHDLGAISDV